MVSMFLKELILIKEVHQDCNISCCCYFLNKRFKFQPYVSNRCHDLLMMSMNFSNIAILKMPIIVVLFVKLEKVKI